MFKSKFKGSPRGREAALRGFTLIELLVVIAIIGLLVTLSILALSNARVASRDSKRVADIKQMQSALELFYDANDRYPTNAQFQSGSISYISSSTGTTTYMGIIPVAPTPNDGACSSGGNNYVYNASADGSSYTLNFCVSKKINDLPAGNLIGIPGGIIKGFACGDSLTYAGESYPTVQIGTQCWFAKNMDAGTRIVGTSNQVDASGGIFQKYCYSDSDTICGTDGGLYQWHTAMALPVICDTNSASSSCVIAPVNHQGICPAGWHIPSDADQYVLENYLKTGSNSCDPNRLAYDCDTAGTKLKVGGSSNFNLVLAGYRLTNGTYGAQTTVGFLWSKSVDGVNSNYYRRIDSAGSYPSMVFRASLVSGRGLSVRCLQN
jgi:uncharacterized protein (TIGR02145 family)/prepilin-type N-terminal cleavage/methylation domain-containing protein